MWDNLTRIITVLRGFAIEFRGCRAFWAKCKDSGCLRSEKQANESAARPIPFLVAGARNCPACRAKTDNPVTAHERVRERLSPEAVRNKT